MQMTYEQFMERFSQRTNDVESLVRTALVDMLPEGYVLTDDRNVIHGNALMAIVPSEPHPGSMSVHLYHSQDHRPTANQMLIPSTELLSIMAFNQTWKTDFGYGDQGQITVEVIGGDLVSAVRELISTTLTQPMFAAYEWRKNDHDTLKHELFLRGRKVQSVWKSGNRWGTLIGNSPATLALAKAEAEAAAKLSLKSFHDERLASLDRLAA